MIICVLFSLRQKCIHQDPENRTHPGSLNSGGLGRDLVSAEPRGQSGNSRCWWLTGSSGPGAKRRGWSYKIQSFQEGACKRGVDSRGWHLCWCLVRQLLGAPACCWPLPPVSLMAEPRRGPLGRAWGWGPQLGHSMAALGRAASVPALQHMWTAAHYSGGGVYFVNLQLPFIRAALQWLFPTGRILLNSNSNLIHR